MTVHAAQLMEDGRHVRWIALEDFWWKIQTPRLTPVNLGLIDPLPPEPDSVVVVDTWKLVKYRDEVWTFELWMQILGPRLPKDFKNPTMTAPVRHMQYELEK